MVVRNRRIVVVPAATGPSLLVNAAAATAVTSRFPHFVLQLDRSGLFQPIRLLADAFVPVQCQSQYAVSHMPTILTFAVCPVDM